MKLAILSAAALAFAYPALAQTTSITPEMPTQDQVVKSFQETNAEIINALVGTRAMLQASQKKAHDFEEQADRLNKELADLKHQVAVMQLNNNARPQAPASTATTTPEAAKPDATDTKTTPQTK